MGLNSLPLVTNASMILQWVGGRWMLKKGNFSQKWLREKTLMLFRLSQTVLTPKGSLFQQVVIRRWILRDSLRG